MARLEKGMVVWYVQARKMTPKQIKRAIVARERKARRFLARIALLEEERDRLDHKLCGVKVDLYALREEAKR